MSFDFYYDDDYDQVLTITHKSGGCKVWMDLTLKSSDGLYEVTAHSTDIKPRYMFKRLYKALPCLKISFVHKQITFNEESRIMIKLKYGVDINVHRPI